MVYKISKNILWKCVDSEIVIVDPGKDSYSYLNATGARIWVMIDKGHTRAAVVEALSQEYDAPAAKIKKEVDALFGDLIAAGLIQEA